MRLSKLFLFWVGIQFVINEVWIINPGKFAIFLTGLATGLFTVYCLGERLDK